MSRQEEPGTWRLRKREPQAPADGVTVRLHQAPEPAQSWTAVPLAGDDSAERPALVSPDLATVRAPESGPADASGEVRQTLIRFGPGVPDPRTAHTAAVWHGTAQPAAPPRARRRRASGYAFAAVALLAVLAFLLWERFGGPALAVRSVSVSAAPGTLSCGGTEDVVATVRTNGKAGTLRYHWHRSDGTDSGPQRQTLTSGPTGVGLPLRWTFQGHGAYRATALLEIDSPGTRTASVSFGYSCR